MRIPASARTVLYPLQSYLLYPEPEKLVEWMSVFPTRLTIVSTLREWNSQGLRVSAGQLAQDCLCAPLEGAWVDLRDEKPFLAPGNMAARINAELKARGFPEVTQPHELASVVFRSLAKRYAEVIDGIQRCTGKPLERLCIVGGGVRNEVLNRLAQEATGLELLKGSSEATLIGNAAMQIAALENTHSLEDIQSIASRLRFEEGDGTITPGT